MTTKLGSHTVVCFLLGLWSVIGYTQKPNNSLQLLINDDFIMRLNTNM